MNLVINQAKDTGKEAIYSFLFGATLSYSVFAITVAAVARLAKNVKESLTFNVSLSSLDSYSEYE